FTQGTFTSSTSAGGTVTIGTQSATFSQGTLTGNSFGSVALGTQTATFSQGLFSIPGSFTAVNYQLIARFPVNPLGQVVITASPGTSPFVYQNAFKIDAAGRLVTATSGGKVWQNDFQFDANNN